MTAVLLNPFEDKQTRLLWDSTLKIDCAVSYGSRLGRGLGKHYLFIPYC